MKPLIVYKLLIDGKEIDYTIQESITDAQMAFWEKWPELTAEALKGKKTVEIRVY